MPIRFSCGSCASVLRVAERHIGKQAKCPKCGEKCVVPPESEPDQAASLGVPSQQTGRPQPIGPPDIGPPSLGPPSLGPPSLGPPSLGPPSLGPPSVGPSQTASAIGLPSIGAPPAGVGASASPSIAPAGNEPPAVGSPYSAPLAPGSSGDSLSNTVMHPLYQVRNMMNWFGWFMFVVGCIYCITVVGAIVGWLPLWIGSLIKGASKSIKLGVERGDQNQLLLANQRLATFFKICGVITIIYVCVFGIMLALFLVGVIVGAVNAV